MSDAEEMGDAQKLPEDKELGEADRLTTQWSVEDEEEAARERRRRERERQGQPQEEEGLTGSSPSVDNGVSEVLANRCDFKPVGSSELEEDEGFSDWSLKLEQRKQRSSGAQEAEAGSAMSAQDSGPFAGEAEQRLEEDTSARVGFVFKPFTGAFASLRIDPDFDPSEESSAQHDECPEEGSREEGQMRMKMSPPRGLCPSPTQEEDAGLGEAEAQPGRRTLSQDLEEESCELERTIRREAELEELEQEAQRREQEAEQRRREAEERRLEEEEHRREAERRREAEEERREEEHRWEEERRRQEKLRALEEVEKRKAEEELDRRRWETADRCLKIVSSPGSDGDESHRPLSPMSPTVKILERTESLNRSIKKSNSVKKTQPALPISKIDDRLEQYTHAIESSAKTPKMQRQPSIELISTVEAVANKKNLWEAGEASAQSPAKGTPCKDTEGLNVPVSDLINQFAKGTPGSNAKSSPSKAGGSAGNKKYKFVPTGHGKYEKVFTDDH